VPVEHAGGALIAGELHLLGVDDDDVVAASICGVKIGLCLPRSRIATMVASRPSTSPSASITTHFLSMSASLAENVFIGKSA